MRPAWGKKIGKVEKFEFVKFDEETLLKKRTQKRSDTKVKLEKNGIGIIELEMVPLKLNHIKQLITLAVITLSCFHCIKLFVFELSVPAERNYDTKLAVKAGLPFPLPAAATIGVCANRLHYLYPFPTTPNKSGPNGSSIKFIFFSSKQNKNNVRKLFCDVIKNRVVSIKMS